MVAKRTADGKKRCPITNLVGLQCTKQRNHVSKELDVVHQAGMFIWRNDTNRVNLDLGRPKMVRLGDVDLTSMVRNVGIQVGRDSGLFSTTTQAEAASPPVTPMAPPPSDDSVCDCSGCRYLRGEVTQEQIRDEWGQAAKAFAEGDDEITASPEQQLHEWWIQQAEDECARTIPKAIEYSATDLTDIGHDLARTQGREVDDEEAAELGVFFYLRGKVARWVGAVVAGQRVSDDTLFDIGVYVRMAQRIREKGNWPGTEEPGVEPDWNERSAG